MSISGKDETKDVFVEDSEKTATHPTLLLARSGDVALSLANQGERVVVTEEDSRRICRKTDWNVLTLLCWAYFLVSFHLPI